MKTGQRYLVTGASGFVGRYLVDSLTKQGNEVRVVRSSSTQSQEFCGVGEIACNLQKDPLPEAAFSDVDTVIHLASTGTPSSPQVCNERILELNVLGTQRLLQGACEAGVSRFVYASSASVYGAGNGEPLSESLPTSPSSIYATSRAAAENLCSAYRDSYGLDTRIVRLFNEYGPGQNEDMVIPRFMRQILRGDAITLIGNGDQERDFVYVTDVVAAILSAGEDLATRHRVFNAGAGSTVKIRVLVEQIAEVLGVTPRIKHAIQKAGGVDRSLACTRRVTEELNWSPKVSLREGLLRTAQSIGNAI